jgi:pyroglutamyl-peptidase
VTLRSLSGYLTSHSLHPEPVRLEKLARNGPYNKPDNQKDIPEGNHIHGPDTLYTKVDLDQILEWGKKEKNWGPEDVRISEDAGLYLCEWSFFVSLRESSKEDTGHAIVQFIHVPTIGDGNGQMSLEKMTKIVTEIIEGVISHY